MKTLLLLLLWCLGWVLIGAALVSWAEQRGANAGGQLSVWAVISAVALTGADALRKRTKPAA
jgi:membrane protein DedA with SNARE-associated domain